MKKITLTEINKRLQHIEKICNNNEVNGLRKGFSTMQKTITRLKSKCTFLTNNLILRREQARQLSKFLDWAVKNKKITKKDIKRFFLPRNIVKKKLTKMKILAYHKW